MPKAIRALNYWIKRIHSQVLKQRHYSDGKYTNGFLTPIEKVPYRLHSRGYCFVMSFTLKDVCLDVGSYGVCG